MRRSWLVPAAWVAAPLVYVVLVAWLTLHGFPLFLPRRGFGVGSGQARRWWCSPATAAPSRPTAAEIRAGPQYQFRRMPRLWDDKHVPRAEEVKHLSPP